MDPYHEITVLRVSVSVAVAVAVLVNPLEPSS